MATGAKMSYNFYQNGKHGTLPQKDMEITQDMHLKMSKKIAQLTKVIYALNTKNDEHDAVVQSIKETHEEQMQQLMAETRDKLEHYKNKLINESENSKQVEELQRRLKDYEMEKNKTLLQMQEYKRNAEETQLQKSTEHSQKMLALSTEVLQAKKDFEGKLQLMDKLKEQYERDKQETINELTEKHKKEIEELLQSKEGTAEELLAAKAELEQKYESELQRLKDQVDEMENDKKQTVEDYEDKLSKAQAFYEKELEVLRNNQNASANEQLEALQQKYDKLKKDSAFEEKQLRQRLDGTLSDLSKKEEEIEMHLTELARLNKFLKDQGSSSDVLQEQLRLAREEASAAMTKLKDAEMELYAVKDRCEQQAKELVKKSSDIGELEATKLQHESIIADLQSQLTKLQERVHLLEGVKRALESQNQVKSEEQNMQLVQLEQQLEDLSIAKQKLQEMYDRDIKSLDSSSKDRQKMLEDENKAQLEAVEHKYKTQMELLQKELDLKYASMKQDLEARLHAERDRLTKEKDAIRAEFDQVRNDLTNKLSKSDFEVRRLDKIVQDSQQGLGSANTHISSLKDAHDRMKNELDQTRAELRTSKNKNTLLESDYDRLKKLYDSKLKEHEQELKEKLDKLSKDLESKWQETLTKETMKLRHELQQQKEEDKKAAMNSLIRMKEEEMAALKQGWERKVTQLMSEISGLKQQLQSKESDLVEEIERLKQTAEEENRKLMQEMLKSAEEYAKKIESLEEVYKDKLKQLGDQKDREASALEDRLKNQHIEDMRLQLGSHKVTIDAIKDQADRARDAVLKEQREKLHKEQDLLQEELENKHLLELEEHNRAHQQQMMAARMELDRALELSKQKETDHAMKQTELEEDIRHREIQIQTLDGEIRNLQSGISDMSKALEMKGKEVNKIRSEANQAARIREEQLIKAHKDEISNLIADQQNEAREMLAEFSQAQDLLKDKIGKLHQHLQEAEERYLDRDSRPEDLEEIERLRLELHEREQLVKRMDDEKRYFQRELVNRETNFNKVFNSDPKVGVLNPFNSKSKKKGGKDPRGYNSSPNMQRLDPIPGVPLHHDRLNSLHPIPPTKKFVQ